MGSVLWLNCYIPYEVIIHEKNLQGMIEAGESPMQQAVEALRCLREAEAANSPPEEVERLRIIADSLFQAVSNYQLRSLVGLESTRH